MKILHSNKLGMYNALLSILKQEEDALKNVPAFNSLISEFENIYRSLFEEYGKYDTARSSVKSSGEKIKTEFKKSIIKISSALIIIADQKKDDELKSLAVKGKSYINRMKNAEKYSFASIIKEYCEKYKSDLATAGITEAELTNFSISLENFHQHIGKSLGVYAVKEGSREKIKILFKKADNLLRVNLDNVLSVMQFEYPELYSKYSRARKKWDHGIRHLTSDTDLNGNNPEKTSDPENQIEAV